MLLPMRRRLGGFGARFSAAGGRTLGRCSLAAAFVLVLAGCTDERRPATFPNDDYPAQQPAENGAAAYAATGVASEGVAEGASDDAEPAGDDGSQEVYGPEDGDAEASSAPADYDPAADQDPSAMTEFQPVLAPYGAWVDDATYGTVWVPSESVVGADFAPYVSAGHWAMTDGDEWIWVSDYDWGWAPFHYGRWVWIGGRGWAWIPGRVYAPAWVVWRTGYYDDYYVGWAPMPPTWYWSGGVAVSLWVVPPAPYVFCSSRYVFEPGIRTHIVPASRVGVVATHTRPYVAAAPGVRAGYSSYVRGPSRGDAHLPARPVPRAAPDTRALSFAKPVPGGRLGAAPAPARGVRPRSIGGRTSAGAPVYGRPAPTAGARPVPGAPPRGAPGFRPSPTARPGAPSYGPAPRYTPAPAYRPSPSPSYGPAPSYRPAPSYGPSPSFRPSPAPAPHYTPAPSFRPSPAPAPAYRPSQTYHPPSGGGRAAPTFRGGGGRHR